MASGRAVLIREKYRPRPRLGLHKVVHVVNARYSGKGRGVRSVMELPPCVIDISNVYRKNHEGQEYKGYYQKDEPDGDPLVVEYNSLSSEGRHEPLLLILVRALAGHGYPIKFFVFFGRNGPVARHIHFLARRVGLFESRRYEERELGLLQLLYGGTEKRPENRYVAEERNLAYVLLGLLAQKPREDEALVRVQVNARAHFPRVYLGRYRHPAEAYIARDIANLGRVYLQSYPSALEDLGGEVYLYADLLVCYGNRLFPAHARHLLHRHAGARKKGTLLAASDHEVRLGNHLCEVVRLERLKKRGNPARKMRDPYLRDDSL